MQLWEDGHNIDDLLALVADLKIIDRCLYVGIYGMGIYYLY